MNEAVNETMDKALGVVSLFEVDMNEALNETMDEALGVL